MESPIQRHLDDLLQEVSRITDGSPYAVHPPGREPDPDAFGICLATVDGHIYTAGAAAETRFSLHSISKPLSYDVRTKLLVERGHLRGEENGVVLAHPIHRRQAQDVAAGGERSAGIGDDDGEGTPQLLEGDRSFIVEEHGGRLQV